MPTVLVVEDNSDNMVLITRVLEKAGYQSVQADSGEAGVERFLEMVNMGQPPDFVIMDIQLPGISGLEATRKIRESGGNGTIPIIAVTSYALKGDRERAEQSGCTGYIEKPFNPVTLVDELRTIIEKRKK
ncbi:MAG: response regulator [Desulfobulbaceae bacterium]|uniref:Response regulator n=1 Tax=Candidatus Desulfobia pelagia TaxID=2841692 RepID=A0A8J6TCW2_9BACT|nr:response regulator [Candidatus Desulfobia pelagia]